MFHWKSLQPPGARCADRSSPSTDAEADAYFATRPRLAQIGAWASKQSAPLESRSPSRRRSRSTPRNIAIGAVPRPPYWSGFRIVPLAIEFWQDRPFRLHDRIEFRRAAPSAPWSKTRLYP